MPEQEYFKQALRSFAHEAASGGAIRHLVDLGYTAGQITGLLAFPTPYEKVRETVWKHLVDTGTVLLEEPGSGQGQEKGIYVKEYDAFGRASFRLAAGGGREQVPFRESRFCEGKYRGLADFLAEKCAGNGTASSYISCDFGLPGWRGGDRLLPLDKKQQDYVMGLPWEAKRCYHRLDRRMREIATRLYEAGASPWICYFLKTKEKIIIISD